MRPRKRPSFFAFLARTDPLKTGDGTSVSAEGDVPTAIVVMLMTLPLGNREWAVWLISMVKSRIGGGAEVIDHFGLHRWSNSLIGLCAMGELIFACGLPG